MANSKIYLGSTNIGSLFQGADDISIYLGENKVYPLEWRGKFYATYSGGETYDLACDGNTTLTSGNTKPSGYEYSAMTEAIIGDCVTKIGYKAFSGCTSLTNIDIPTGVTSIGDGAFEGCSGLTTMDIPSGITTIGQHTFYNCSSLTSIGIPNGVTSIGNAAFQNCRSLTSVTIPSGVTSIEYQAFVQCTSLNSITCLATTPPTLNYRVFNTGNSCPIYVPSASVNAYKTADKWSDYASRIQAIP